MNKILVLGIISLFAFPAAAQTSTSTAVQNRKPVRLTIPSLKVNAPIVATGLTEEGRMEVPDNYTQVGWYKYSAVPGYSGSAVMGAHVDNGGKISGVFKKLKYIQPGATVYVYGVDGKRVQYKVKRKVVYHYKTPFTQEVFSPEGSSRLNLITCYGTWLPKENTYDRRIVIYTEKV